LCNGRCAAATATALLAAWPGMAAAYTAAGDRNFPATMLLPQAAPADEVYVTPSTIPVEGGRASNLDATFAKTITEDLGVQFEEGHEWLDRKHAPTLSGWLNLETTVKYIAVLDPAREALLSFGIDREWGGTGAKRVGASPIGATSPQVYFAKGLGDWDLGYLRPLAVIGNLGYQISDGHGRPDKLLTGVAVEYSIPYLQSKVAAFDLPDLVRATTPVVETFVTTPVHNRNGNAVSATIAPGVSYSGQGWEFAVEALVPATRAAGTGPGVIAQFHLSLDYFFPDGIGKPLLSER
jgi:hypothetical protein